MKVTSCGVMLQKDNKILLVKSGYDQPWGFPKGKVESDDRSKRHTACRELYEELGIELESNSLGTEHFQKNKRKDIYIYETNIFGDVEITRNHKEIYEYKWFTVDELHTLDLCKNQLEIFSSVMKG